MAVLYTSIDDFAPLRCTLRPESGGSHTGRGPRVDLFPQQAIQREEVKLSPPSSWYGLFRQTSHNTIYWIVP